MPRMWIRTITSLLAVAGWVGQELQAQELAKGDRVDSPIQVETRPVSADPSIKLDYDIVYVRGPRRGDDIGTNWAEISSPLFMDPGADLMLLHPDGSEELLVAGGKGSVADPMVSFDGQWVYYAFFHDQEKATITESSAAGADIYKVHVKSRNVVRLTHQRFTPNTGAGRWSKDIRTPGPTVNSIDYGVFNTGPCPLPGGKVVFTSNRNAFRPPKRLPHTLQLFVMDDDGANVECIGHLNLGMALHPVILRDGRIIFSSLESQGLRTSTLWGLWSIHPDGTNWGPILSAFLPGESPSAYHFQTQLGNGSIVAEEYYNQTSSGFGSFVKLPVNGPGDGPSFGPGSPRDSRNTALRGGRLNDGSPRMRRLPFSPRGIESLTRFARTDEGPADFADVEGRSSGRVGKVTHPSAAPDNHVLTVWSRGPVNGGYTVHVPAVDSGLYLIKGGTAIDEPGQMLLIKNDPNYNEQWPRALVPYRRIYGIDEPRRIAPLLNDGERSKHLPPGTPFGLIGTSSLYKRESYPGGVVPAGAVTATFGGGPDRTGGYRDLDSFNTSLGEVSSNWFNQGADAGRYRNEDIQAIRILVMEPTTDRQRGPKSGRTFRSHANERLRILGEIPVRKFAPTDDAESLSQGKRQTGNQPTDPDGNPDTSFLARIPADVAFTFQTLDGDGMVLNMAQTWHQLRPGEIRNDCGGCHAHSQKPTLFEQTAAASPDYRVFDLTEKTPLLTTRKNDQSGRKWDAENAVGLRYEMQVKNVEYFRDVKPVLDRSCAACHSKEREEPAGDLVLDDDKIVDLPNADDVPGTYYRLAMDYAGRFGKKPIVGSWRHANASRYVRMFQSRRSLLIWKVFGRRTDGWSNDDFPTETVPGDPKTLRLKGKSLSNTSANRNRADLDYTGSIMPPTSSVAGTAVGPDGRKIKVAPLSDEDRMTLVRWIDLGCPIDLDFDPARPEILGMGWLLDDQRPTLTLTSPHAGRNPPISRILVGMYDYGGLDMDSFQAVASFAVNDVPAGQNFAKKFGSLTQGVWELEFKEPVRVEHGSLIVSVKDRQGNETRIERTFSAGTGVRP
jgi:Hydrazine synthase alpha subunit middle domain